MITPDPTAPDLVDVLVPTYRRPGALAVTLAGLAGQTHRALRVVVSDQTDSGVTAADDAGVQAVVRVLRARGTEVECHTHLPRRGLAEHRQSLLDRATARHALFLDDDVLLEPEVVARLVRVIGQEGCGLVGAAMIGLSYAGDVRPHQQAVELWDGPVTPERVVPGTPAWERYRLHNAANLLHVERALGADDASPLRYKIAWAAGCVMFDTAVLRDVGGFGFWRDLPADHAGEDVLAQLRVMAAAGGCGVMPSGAYHQELPTTVHDREVDAPRVLGWGADDASAPWGAVTAGAPR